MKYCPTPQIKNSEHFQKHIEALGEPLTYFVYDKNSDKDGGHLLSEGKTAELYKQILDKTNNELLAIKLTAKVFGTATPIIKETKEPVTLTTKPQRGKHTKKETVKKLDSSKSPSENLSITSLTLYDNLQQENDIINSLTSTALSIIDDIKGGEIPTSLTDVLDQVKQELQDEYDYYNYFSENQPDKEDIANGALESMADNKTMADRFKFVLDNFEKVKDGDKVKYIGIRDRIANKINSLKFSINEDLVDETNEGLEKESYEDSWMQKISAENSMSAQVKRLLTFIPARDFKGNEKSNTLGYKVYEDYTKVYSLIQNMLVDIPIEYIYDELVELSSKNVIVKDVLVALDKLKDTSPKDYNNFHVTMRRQEANFITVLANPKDKNNKASYQAFNTNQANASDNVINIWHEDFKTKGLESGLLEVDKETGALITNVDKAKEIYKEFDTNFKEKDFKKRLEIIASSLNKIGINITSEDLEELNKFRQLYNGEITGKTYLKGKNNRYSRYYKAKTFNDFVGTELKPLFLTLTGQLKDDSATTAWETNNPYFSQSSRMKGLTSYYLTKNPDVANSSTFRNGNGDLIQGIMMPHYASNRMYKIANDDKLKAVFKGIPFTKHATWLNQDVKMRYFDSASMRDSKQDSKNYADQSPSEKEFTKIALFQNVGRKKMITIGNTPSDKTMFKLFEVDRHDLNLDNRDNVDVFEKGIINKDNIDLNSPTMNTLYTLLVQSEINRIIAVRRAFKEKNYKDLIAGYHYFEVKDDKGKITRIIGSGGYFYFIPELNELLNDYLHDGVFVPGIEGEKDFREALRNKVVQLIEDKVQSWNEKGIVNLQDNTHNFDKSYAYNVGQKIEKNNKDRNIINKAAADMVINYMMSYANEFQLITGDPALFAKPTLLFKDWKGLLSNTADNIFKRTAKDIAPGLEGKFEDTTFKSIFINEPTVTSAMATYADRIGVDLANKYDKLDIADAQEWTTLKEHLNVLHAYGKIDKQTRDNLINKAEQRLLTENKEDYNFTWEELGTVLQPVKPVYVSSKYNPDLQVDEQYYIKTSSFPLIPQLTEDLEIDKLRIAMESSDNNIDRAVVFSGVKLGFTKGIDIFDKNGDVNIPSNLKESIQDLPRDGFRIQQEVPYDILKEKILEGSQLRKLAFANLTPNMNFNFVYGENKTHKGYQLKQLSDNIHSRLYELKYNQLLKDLGVPEGQNTITDVNKLKDVLEETATELGYNINDILMLTNTITLNGGRVAFEIPLFFHNQSNKIESMLNSIIKNRVLKNKMPGKSFVQGSSVGFNTTYKMRNEKFLETMLSTSKKRIVYTKNAEGKRNFQGSLDYREYEENGQKIIYAEVFAPFNFIREGKKLRLEDYTDEQGFIKQDKIDNELLNILGYRIPTQGHSSMMKLKVVGFLPQEAGDLIIVPAAITKQMGSDFDVDKLYTHNFNYKFGLGGRINKVDYSTKEEDFSKLSEKELQNMVMDIYFSILDNPDVQNKYQFVLTDDPTLKNDKAKLNEYRENVPKNTLRNKPQKSSLLYDEYQAHMVEVNAAGKIGIGSYSSASANHILFQYAGVYLKVPTNSKGKLLYDKAVSVKFKDEKGNVYTDKLEGEDFLNNRVNNINTIEYIDNVGEGAWRLDKAYTFTGKLISDVIKSYQSSSVDNAKDQNLYDLHQNKHTFSVSWLIARAGFDEYFINRFVSQPAIIEYVEGLNNLDNYTDNEFDPTKKLKLQQRLFEELGQNFDEWGYGITAPSLSEMEAAIKDNGADKLFQAQMLWNFIKYAEVASEISRVQTSANTDTAFLGKSIYESILKQSIINEKKQFLGNTDNLFKETTQQGAVTYGLNASVDLFSSNNLFPIKSTAVLGIFDTIKNELDKDIREDIAFNIVSDIRASLFSNAVIDVYGKDINTVRRELLFGDNSLAKRLKAFQATTTNPFFKVLQVITGATKEYPDVIEFSSSKDIRDELDISMLLGWNSALNSSNEQERQLAEDLVLYSLINGNQRNARDFGRFLPYDYIANKLAPYYRKLDFDNSKEGIDLLEANFTIQWLQHNPYRSRETVSKHWDKATTFDGKEVGENEAPDIITLKSIDNPDIEQLMSYNNGAQLRKPLTLVYKYKDSKGKSQITLYKQQDFDYVRIPVLGLSSKLIKEYDISNPNQQSVFREPVGTTEKKVTITLEPKLPESKKEQDLFDSYNYNGGITSVLESIANNSQSEKYQAIAKFYLKHKDLIKDYKLDFYDSKRNTNLQNISDSYDIGTDDGRIWYNDVIILNKDNIKDSSRFERVFLHEVTHALVHARLGSEHKANKQLQSIMDELKKHSDLFTDTEWLKKIGVTKIGKMVGSNKEGYIFGDYIFTDTQEFAAALMTDKDLYKILYNIPFEGDKSFWDKIREFIVQLLGFDTGDTLLTEGMSTVLNIIENQNFDQDIIDGEIETSLSPSGKVYPMKPAGRVFKLAIDKDGHYIPEIANSENKRRIVNEHFRFRGDKSYNSANKPYTTFTKGNAQDDIKLVHEINNQYTGRVVAYHPQTSRIIFTPDVDNYTLKGDQLQFEFSSSPMESTLFSEQKLINIKKTQLEIFKSRLTEKGVNREDLKKKINILEAQIEKLTEKGTQQVMEEVTKKTLESTTEVLNNIQDRLNSEPSEEELYNIFTDLRDVDVYLEGMLNIDKLIEYEGKEAINRIDVLQADINRERVRYLEQIKQATVQFAHKVGSERFKDISEEDLFKDVEDISFMVRETLNMANSPSMLVRLMHQIIQLSKQNMLEEQRKVATSVDTWVDKLKKHTKLDEKGIIDIFKQKYEDGSWTGNFISKYKQEFFDTRNDIWNKVNDGDLTVKEAIKWLKDNTTLITKEELESGKSSIFTEEEMTKQKELLEKYEEDKRAQREALENTYIRENGTIDEREVDLRMDDWIQRNSPEIYLSYYHDNQYQRIRPKGYKYLIYAKPKDKWLDKRFDRIQNDEVLLGFYNFMVETFEANNKVLPFMTKIPGNYLPEMSKTFMQKIKNNNMLEAFSIVGDEFWQTITDDVEGEIDYTHKLGNRKFKTIPTRMMMNKLYAKDKSDDIFKILKAHTSMANSYRFKSKVEPILTAGQQQLEELGEITTRETVKGKVTTKNKYKETDVQGNKLVNTKKQFEHQVETFLYENYRDVEGRLGKVFLSEKDKAKKAELDELLAQEKITPEQYQTRVSTLGRQITATGIMDVVNKYTYLRALGLPNFATPTVNLTFGLASNLTYASGNEGTNLTDMRKAIGMYTNAILTKKDIKKLWAFMEELGILDEYNESLYGTERTLVDEMAFILQNKTEKMNRGTMMLSHLLSFKVKNKDGKEVSLYYAFKEVEGKLVWDTENFGEREEIESTKIIGDHGVNMYRLKTFIGKVNQRVHGDYESALRAKRTILGRSLFMFKTWMAMGLVERFGSEEFDDDLGRVVKGRYTVGWTATDVEGNKISIQKLLGIITKAAFTKEGLSGLSEVDRASVRRNLKELQFITQFSIAVAALLLVAKETDDDDEYKFALNTLINILTKAQADLAYFTNPSSALELTNNIMPIISSINDIYKFLPALYKTISGDPTYQSGPLKDSNRLLIWGAQATPGLNAGLRIWKNGERVIEQF